MTTYPTVDIKTIKPDEVLALLAELPCTFCRGSGTVDGGMAPGGTLDFHAHLSEPCPKCEGDGLAFEWASEECNNCGYNNPQHDDHCSGRILKADLRQEDVQTAIIEKGFDYNLSSTVFSIVRGQEPGDVIAFCGIGEPIPTSPMLVWADTPLDAMLKAFLQMVLSDDSS